MKIKTKELRLLILEELAKVLETTDPAWRQKVKALRKRWDDYQENIPRKIQKDFPVFGYWETPEGELDQDYKDIDIELQDTAGMEKPPFAKGKPEYDPAHEIADQRYYKDYTHAAELRRVAYGQTKGETDLDRELMSLWQDMADLEFFKSGAVTYTHDIGYKSAAKMMWGPGEKSTYSPEESWLAAQERPEKSSVSTTAAVGDFPTSSAQWGLSGGFGYFVEGHPIFINAGDLASQTQRMADDEVRAYYKHSGLPKRASLAKFGGKSPEPSRFRRKRMKKKGMSDEEIDAHFQKYADSAILNKEDMLNYGGQAGEAIIANWTIKAWYVNPQGRTANQAFKFFQKHRNRISKPIYVGSKPYTVEEFLSMKK